VIDFNEGIENIVDLIKKKEIAILYGAGLSYNSGVLKACDFYKYILSELKDVDSGYPLFDEKTIEHVAKRTCQFEDFLMRLFDDTNTDADAKSSIFRSLLKTFGVGKPNTNHYFLADMMQKGFINTIFTTNFDRLFECAFFETTDGSSNIPLIQYISNKNGSVELKSIEKRFYNHYFTMIDEKRKYIKLHGCVTNLDRILTFLPEVASKNNVDCINTILKEAFSQYKYLLVMGYSFSDAYDIVKVMRKINDRPEFFIVNHNIKNKKYLSIEEFLKKKENEDSKIPRDFKGYVFDCNTDDFVEIIWNKIGTHKPKNPMSAIDESKTLIREFISDLKLKPKEGEGYYIYLHAWRYHYELGQNLFLLNRQLSKTANSELQKILIEKQTIMKNALDSSIIYAQESINKVKDDNRFLAMKHLYLSNIALKCNSENDLKDYFNRLKELATDVYKIGDGFRFWAWSEIMYFYSLWRYELSIYADFKASSAETIELLDEINNVLFKIESFINGNNGLRLVYYRLLTLKEILRSHLNLDNEETEKVFIKAENEFYKQGRVEYLSFVNHCYGKFLKNKIERNGSYFEIANSLRHYDKAIYLYKNLGDEERKDICEYEKKELLLNSKHKTATI